MKHFVAIVTVFILFQFVTSRPSTDDGTITKDIKVELPGSERINRRSVDEYAESSEATSAESEGQEDVEYAADSSENDDSPVIKREVGEFNEDFEEAVSSLRLKPFLVFGKRSVNNEQMSRPIRSVTMDQDVLDEMKAAENGMVFLPVFRSRNRFSERQRFRRSLVDVTKLKPSDTESDLEPAETMIFMPVFRHNLRPVRSIPEEESFRRDNGDDMAIAENGLVFRPLFRTRQRDTRSVEIEN